MRRGFAVLALTAASSLAVGGPATVATAATRVSPHSYTDSVTYQVNANHDGLASGSAIPAKLAQKWSKDLGGLVSYPLIAGGRVFVTAAHASGSGTDLYAFDAQTGDPLWGPIDLAGPYGFSSLAYESGRVFTVNGQGLMNAYQDATGALLWSQQLPGQYSFSSPLTASGGVVYTGGAGSGGTLYAVDELSGDVNWTASVENGDDSGPAVDSSGVYVSYACELSYRFSFKGKQIWNHQGGCEGGGGRTPVLHGGDLWVRDDAGMQPAVLSKSTGDLVRAFTSSTAPAFTGSLGLTLSSGTLSGITAATGAVNWSTSGDGQLASAPAISGSTAYVGSGTGTVFGYNVRTGKQVWSGSAGAPVLGPDEHNAEVLQGLAIGDGVLAVPASTRLTVFG